MYYYILEQAANYSIKRQQEIAKNLVESLGISGETVSVSPARTVEELTTMGMSKGYSTIVAVGSDLLVNKIASLIQSSNLVLGVIPIGATELVTNLIGANDLKTSCENLRFRRVENKDLGMIEPNKYFLTEAVLESPKSISASIDLDEAKLDTTFTKIVISSELKMSIEDSSKNPGILTKTASWLLGKKTTNFYPSLFISKKIKIETTEPVTVTVSNDHIAKTPVVLRLKPKTLKLVVGRGKIE